MDIVLRNLTKSITTLNMIRILTPTLLKKIHLRKWVLYPTNLITQAGNLVKLNLKEQFLLVHPSILHLYFIYES